MARGADDCGGSPLLDLGLLAIPSFRRGVLVARCSSSPPRSTCAVLGIYEQEGFGTDPLFTGLAILPYGVGLFVGPLVTAPLARLRPWLLTIGMAIQVAGYAGVAAVIAAGYDHWPVVLTVLLAGSARASRIRGCSTPRWATSRRIRPASPRAC